MSKKLKKSEYENVAECIVSDQVPSDRIAGYFKDKEFYKYYKKNYMWVYSRPELDT
jgi:hypothetical protein|tara:strand:+ start:400 stop:567 length:168 start_codon:yes stop_codon:yes gene_type:complete